MSEGVGPYECCPCACHPSPEPDRLTHEGYCRACGDQFPGCCAERAPGAIRLRCCETIVDHDANEHIAHTGEGMRGIRWPRVGVVPKEQPAAAATAPRYVMSERRQALVEEVVGKLDELIDHHFGKPLPFFGSACWFCIVQALAEAVERERREHEKDAAFLRDEIAEVAAGAAANLASSEAHLTRALAAEQARDEALKAEAAATRLYVDTLRDRDRLREDLWLFGRHLHGCPSAAGFGRIGVNDGSRLFPGDEKTCGCRLAVAAGRYPLQSSAEEPACPHLRCVAGDGRCLDCGAPGSDVRATPPTSAAPERDPR